MKRKFSSAPMPSRKGKPAPSKGGGKPAVSTVVSSAPSAASSTGSAASSAGGSSAGGGSSAMKMGGSAKGKTPMTPKQKKFAALAAPKNKITFADRIAGSKKKK